MSLDLFHCSIKKKKSDRPWEITGWWGRVDSVDTLHCCYRPQCWKRQRWRGAIQRERAQALSVLDLSMDQINFKGLSVLCEHWTFLVVVVYLNGNSKTDISSRLTSLHFLHVLYFFNTVLNWTEQSFLLFTLQSRSRPQCWRKGSTKWKDVTQSLTCSWAWVEANQPPLHLNHAVLPTTRTLQTLLSWISATPQPTPHRSNVARPIWKTKQCHNFLNFVLHNQNPLFNG